jgi:hypothetical protein
MGDRARSATTAADRPDIDLMVCLLRVWSER